MSYPERQRSNLWFLLPIFVGLIGGIVAYFFLRKDEPKKAKNCLYVGIAMMIAGLIFNAIIASFIPELGPGVRVNV